MTNSTDSIARIAKDQVQVPVSDTTVYHALMQRRMAWAFKDQPVAREALERMLATAVWAPNHRLTEPWRFKVLTSGSPVKQQAGDLAYQYEEERGSNPRRCESRREKLTKSPVVIFAYAVPGKDAGETKENYASVCCAIHNICLAAVAEGLAVAWETGGTTRNPKLKELLNVPEDWDPAGMLLIGAPDETINSQRTPVDQFTTWY